MNLCDGGKIKYWESIRSRVVVYESAFSSTPKVLEVRAGRKIKDYSQLKDYPFDNSLIFVNGNRVNEDYKLRKDDICTIRMFPQAVSTATVLGTLKAIGWTIAVVVGTYFATDLVVHAVTGKWIIEHIQDWLLKWLKPDTDESDQSQTETIPSISGARNSSGFGKCYPFVMGKHLFTPNYIGKGYTQVAGTDGEEQYFICEYLAGYNDIVLKDFKLGTRDLASNSLGVTDGFVNIDGYYSVATYDPQIEIISTDRESVLYPQKVSEEQLNIELMNVQGEQPLEVVRFSERYPQKVQVEVTMQGLIGYSDSGKKQNRTVSVQLQYSTDGSATWKNFGEFVGATSYDSATGVSTWTKQKNKVMRFVAERTLTYEEATTCTNKVIEIRVVRTNESATDNRSNDTVVLSAIRTWCYDYTATIEDGHELIPQRPIIVKDRDRVCRVAFKIKANNSLTGTLNEFNFIAQSKGRTFSNGAWSSINTLSLTQNPASIGLLALQSVMRGSNAYDDTRIDTDSWGAFYEWCETNHFKCNGVLVSEKKTIDLVNQILQCGKGVLTIVGNKYGVLIDKPRETPVMVLNAQNVIEASNTKEFEELPDGYKVKFINEVNDYTQDEMIVCYDGHSPTDPDLVLESIEIPFVTDPNQIWKITRYQLACRKLRPEIWNRKVSVEGSLIEIGDLVTIQDDTIVVGIGEGAEVVDLVYDDDENPTYITGIKTDGMFDVADATVEYGVAMMIADGVNVPKVVKKKVVISATGTYSNFTFDEPILASSIYKPNIGDIVSFGQYNLETIDAICFGKKSNEDGTYELTLIPYAEGVYTADTGTIPDFDSKVSRPMDYEKGDFGVDKSTDFVSTVLAGLTEGTTTDIEVPNDPINPLAVAEQNKITLTCQLGGGGLRNNLSRFEWQVKKTQEGQWNSIDGEEYIFDRSIDHYPEAEDFASWRFRVRVKSTYNKYSDWVECTVNTSKYGTWTVTPPTITTRTSDRTITLLLGNEERAQYKQQYGEVRYKVQVARYDDYLLDENDNIVVDENMNPVLVYYQPNVNGNPRPVRNSQGEVIVSNEFNYKTSSTSLFALSGSVYSQTMPLQHQDGQTWIDESQREQTGAIDTQYFFKVIAYNATVNTNVVSEPRYASAFALCTNIQDIVFANANVKEQYIQRLSAICANIGVITQGTFGGSQNNYWALSDIDAGSSPTGQALRSGAFRVGGSEKYLLVEPVYNPATGQYDDFEFTLNVGAFEISTERTSLNSELVIYNPEISKRDRTRITTVGTFYEHRDTDDGAWYIIAKQETGGLMSKSVYSNDNLLLTNETITQRRKNGYDFGRPLLSDKSRVWHFDTDAYDHKGNEGYRLEADDPDNRPRIIGADGIPYELDGSTWNPNRNGEPSVDFTPAILSVAPYSDIARSLFGVFKLTFDLDNTTEFGVAVSDSGKFTVDFWIKFYYAENQVLFDIGTDYDRIQFVCTSGEPNYNVPLVYQQADPQPASQSDIDEGEYYIWDNVEEDYVRALTYSASKTYFVYDPEPPYNYETKLSQPSLNNYVEANPQPSSQADLDKGDNIYFVADGNDNYSKATTYEEGTTYYVYNIVYNHRLQDANSMYIRHQGQGAFEMVTIGNLLTEEERRQGKILVGEGEWVHFAVVLDTNTISCYVQDRKWECARYSAVNTGATAIINDNIGASTHGTRVEKEHSAILDELIIDTTVAEVFDSVNPNAFTFLKTSVDKIPFGTIQYNQGHLLLVAQEDEHGKPKLITNIFNSDEFAEKTGTIAEDVAQREIASTGITKEYIRNQNVLSDYSEITLSDIGTTEETAMVFAYDGFISIQAQGRNALIMQIKRGNFTHETFPALYGSEGMPMTSTVPIKKGDKIWKSRADSNAHLFAQYYLLRDYSDRT